MHPDLTLAYYTMQSALCRESCPVWFLRRDPFVGCGVLFVAQGRDARDGGELQAWKLDPIPRWLAGWRKCGWW